jgi:glycosyltransferase involved in cell wall biosynthesis
LNNINKKPSVSIIGSRGYPIVYSGYETFVKELAERLVTHGINVTVYCHKNLFTDRPKKLNGINLVYIPTIQSKILSQLIHSFLSMTHACLGKSDLILAVNAANGPWGMIARMFHKKTAINVDGLEWLRPKWKGLGAKYFKMAAWLSTRLYNRIITDAEAMREVYLREFNCDSTVIAYGANIRYTQNPNLIHQFGLETASYYLIVGRLIPDNNADLLLEGFLASNSSKKLVIVGDVPYQDVYASKMKSRASISVIFTGYITDPSVLAELYHHCYAYLHGHEFGGTNPTMLKAMAYGCAILALDTVFNQEMLQNGAFGEFFQKNALSVSEKLEDAEKSPESMQLLRNHSRNGLTKKYQWDAITDAYIQVFEELLSLK